MGGEYYTHTGGGAGTIFAFHTIQSTTDTATVIKTQDMCSVLNMWSVPTLGILSDEISITMRRLVLSAMSNHVVQFWWCPHEMTVRLAGTESIMGIWWLHITVTTTKKTSSVLTKTLSMFQGARITRMVPYCTTLKGNVELSLALPK